MAEYPTQRGLLTGQNDFPYFGTIAPYEPNMVERAQGLLAEGLMKLGLNPRHAYFQANNFINTRGDMGAADFAPITGDLIGAQDAYDMGVDAKRAFERDEYLKALGYGAGSAATGLLSALGLFGTILPYGDKALDAARVGVKKATELLDDADNIVTGAERDANFKKWFGDSKVVDDAGEPLTVYHSTLKDFDKFKTTTDRSLGAHFGSEEAANNRIESFINRHEENKGITLADKPSQIMPVNLSLKNPFRMDDMISWQPEEVADRINYYISERNLDMPYIKPKHIIDENKNAVKIYNNDEIVSALKKGGYDGIVYENTIEGGGDSFIAFEPEQIKSIHNRGTYNPKDANILKGIAPIAGAGLLGAGMMRQEEQQQGILY